MGNTIKKLKFARMTNDTLLGKDTNCPICGDLFGKNTTYGVFNGHIDYCQSRVGTFPALVKTPSSSGGVLTKSDRPLDKKIQSLRVSISGNTVHFIEGANLLTVRRDHVLEDSRETFVSFNNRKELKILFEGENKSAAIDAGGMLKEWYSLVAEELLNPDYKLFRLCDADEISYFISEENEEEKDRDDKFFFVGLFMAKALFDKVPINMCLSKAIYKYIVSEDGLDLAELKYFDRPLYNSLKYIDENTIDDGSCGEMYFTHLRKNGVEEELTEGGKLLIQFRCRYHYVFILFKIFCVQLKSC